MQPIPLRNARVVVLALAGGALMLSAVLLFLRLSGSGAPGEALPALSLVVPLLGVSNAAVYFLLRRVLVARARAQREACREVLRSGALPRELFQLTLIGAALAEAVGLLGAIAYFLGGNPLLLLAPALAVAAILAQFPRRERFEALLLE